MFEEHKGLYEEEKAVINRIEELRAKLRVIDEEKIIGRSTFDRENIVTSLKANYQVLGMKENEYNNWLEEISKGDN
jgi:hypothetical protein